jgi:hypothetical protein
MGFVAGVADSHCNYRERHQENKEHDSEPAVRESPLPSWGRRKRKTGPPVGDADENSVGLARSARCKSATRGLHNDEGYWQRIVCQGNIFAMNDEGAVKAKGGKT